MSSKSSSVTSVVQPDSASRETASSSEEAIDRIATISQQRPVWVRVGQLIDGVSDRPIRDANLVFDAHRIHYVGAGAPPRAVLAEGRDAPDAALADFTALPCLIEAHAHLFLDGSTIDFKEREQFLKQSPETLRELSRTRWPEILSAGVGAVRDAGDRHGVGLMLAAEAKDSFGKLSATPFIDSPGPALHHRGRYGSFMGEAIEEHADLESAVAARVIAGADRIKLLVSGIINFQAGAVTVPPQMSIDEVKRIVAAASKYGRQTFAHASGADGVEHSIEGGVTSVEHGFFITREQLMKMRDRGIAWVPTFAPVQLQVDRAKELGWDEEVVGHLKRIIASHQRMLTLAGEMGVTIVAGSDAGSCGVPHGLGLLRELHQMEQAGLPPMSVIRSATGASSAALNFPEPIGRLAEGFRSRLIFTRHDPLATAANLQRDKTILFDGIVTRG